MIRIPLLAIIFTVAGWQSQLPAATVEDNLIAGAKKEGALVLYLSTNLTDANGWSSSINPSIPSSSNPHPAGM
jgi:hypothetical protein